MHVKRYEVTTSNGFGRIIHTQVFGPQEAKEAQQYRQDHPQAGAWTIYEDACGRESEEAGLHAAAPGRRSSSRR